MPAKKTRIRKPSILHSEEITQTFRLCIDGPITAGMLSDNLAGLEGVTKHAAEILSGLLGIKVHRAEALILSVELKSIEDGWIFRLVFGKGEAGRKKFEAFRSAVGLTNMTPKQLIGTCVTLSIAAAAWYFWPKAKADPTVEVIINNSFNNMGQPLNKTVEELKAIVDSSISSRESLKRSVTQFIRPDGATGDVELSVNNDQITSLPKEVLSVVPPSMPQPESDHPFKHFENHDILIRAMDLDNAKAGWFAIVDGVSDKRIRTFVAEDIRMETIPLNQHIKADITVTYKVAKNAERKPVSVMITKIHPKPGAVQSASAEEG